MNSEMTYFINKGSETRLAVQSPYYPRKRKIVKPTMGKILKGSLYSYFKMTSLTILLK